MIRALLLTLPALLLAATLAACSHTSSVTRGYAFTLRAADDKRLLVYYQLKEDGEFSYLGGARAGLEDAGLETPNWKARCTTEELADLLAFLAASPDPETTTRSDNGQTFKLALRTPTQGDRRYVSGPTPYFLDLFRKCRDLMLANRPELFESNQPSSPR
ncbi:hypothetical protein BH11PLA1_BH11PLA1_07140 [soil metagenome]